jgi:hypothetical protein
MKPLQLLIRSITSTTWGHEAWPEVKPLLRRALGDAPADRPRGLVELSPRTAVSAPRWPRCSPLRLKEARAGLY